MNPIVTLGIELLELLFCLGVVGSALVILLTSIEDVKESLSRDKVDDGAESAGVLSD